MYQHETKLHTFHKKMVKIVHRYRQYMIQIYTLLQKKIHVQHSVPQNDIIGPHTSIQSLLVATFCNCSGTFSQKSLFNMVELINIYYYGNLGQHIHQYK